MSKREIISAEQIREVLRKCLPEIREKYGVTSIGIFGSYARGEAVPSSDIDIIVEFDRPIGWELVDLADYLESILHHKIDLVIRRSLHPLLRDTILSEVTVRMTARSPALYLSEILTSMDKIERYTAGLSYEEFIIHEEKVDAVERNIEKIGEAAAAIPAEVRDRHPEVPWKTIVGLRNKVIHHYFAVDYEVIWQIVTKNIPATKGKIAEILREYSR